jgi:enoyl-CoA hydratase
MEFNTITFKKENQIGIITINRPDKLNALNSESFDDLNRVIDFIKEKDDILVVVITGSGEKAFVAGADIKELNKCDADTGEDFSRKGQMVFDKIEQLGKPVIAAINGFALGGGCELALACHIRLCSENAKFGQPEVNLGIIPGYGGTQRLARLLNTSIAAQYILTGDMIDSQEAYRIGLVNSVYPQAELMDSAIKLADKVSSKGQIAISYALKSIFSTNSINQSEGLILEAKLFGECCGSSDFKEGTSAFLEKRKPVFVNK